MAEQKDNDSISSILNDSSYEKDTSELDSFFEDLTSLDEADDKPADNLSSIPGMDLLQNNSPLKEEATRKEKSKPVPKRRKPANPKNKKFIYLVALFLLIGFGGYYSYDTFFKNSIFSEEDFDVSAQLPNFPVKPGKIKVLDATKNANNEDGSFNGVGDPDGQFGIQVAVCMFQSCVNEFSYQLRQSNYPVQTFDYSVRGNYFEMITEDSYTLSEAESLVMQINRTNNIMGNAVVVMQNNNSYKVSLGNFFWMEDFKRIKNLIENQISSPRIRLVDNPGRGRASTFKVIAGPFKDKQTADIETENIKKIIGFGQAFVVDIPKL